jgi:putative peptidoglycan lipid II flippase
VTESKKPGLARSAGIVGIATAASRVLGLVREQTVAFLFGASMATDAFNIAFRIPNLLRDLFAEGALSAAFVTTFSQELEEHGKERA